MAKRPIPRVKDNEGTVHYIADDLSGNVSLCGITDWLGQGLDQSRDIEHDTKHPLTCNACKSVFTFCNTHGA
jgi:hypothetical protein